MAAGREFEPEAIHGYFGLSYASWLVLPRVLLQSMPQEWQDEFVALLQEYDAYWRGLPPTMTPESYRVQPTENGNLKPWSDYTLPRYDRGRTVVQPLGTIGRGPAPLTRWDAV